MLNHVLPHSDDAIPTRNIRAVIFDFDGTLADTMPLHYRAYAEAFSEAGIKLDHALFMKYAGRPAHDTIPKLIGNRPCGRTPEEIHQRKKELFTAILATEQVEALPASRFLPLFWQRVPLALASSGSRFGIEVLLKRFGWDHYFEVVLTGEDVDNGKPAPDMFLEAASRLKCQPQQCLVFEDSHVGLEAARRAGMAALDVAALLVPEGDAAHSQVAQPVAS